MLLTSSHPAPEPPILQLRDLAVGYGKPILSLGEGAVRARAGSTIALLGRNGCGKTTLLRTIAGLIPPLRGCVAIQGDSIAALPPRDKARLVAFAPTRHTPDGNVRVEELVMISRFPHQGWFRPIDAHDRDVVNEALRLTQTAQFAQRPIATLSDGERQRVWLAMALAQETPILLLDEPSAFLDFPSKGNLVVLLKELSRVTQRLIIYSTHDLQSALWYSDRLWVLHGAALYDGIPEEAVRSGVLNDVFGTESSVFDPACFTFTPRPPGGDDAPGFFIDAPAVDPDAICARRVLLRAGWREVPRGSSGAAAIRKGVGEAMWYLPNGRCVDSLEGLSLWAEGRR